MIIGVVGSRGIVGTAMCFGFRKVGHEVVEHDLVLNTTIEDILCTDIVFIAVPTPTTKDECNTHNVEMVISDLAKLCYNGVIVLKSTVPPGFTDTLNSRGLFANNIVFNPEFLRERSAISDFCENQDILVIGSHYQHDFELVKNTHKGLPIKETFMVTPKEAETLKYFHNIWNMNRIVFANTFYDVCNHIGVNYNNVRNIAKKHYLFSNEHYLDCSDSWRGAGGACLPKDTLAFSTFVKNILKLDLKLFDFLSSENNKFVITVPEGMRK